MANCYCVYCGEKSSSIQLLTSGNCPRHPKGAFKGKHVLYEGGEKLVYFCKYCGSKFSSIKQMVSGTCPKYPDGAFKGRHSPAKVLISDL